MGTVTTLKQPKWSASGSGDIPSAAAHTRINEQNAANVVIDWQFYRDAVKFHGVQRDAEIGVQVRQLRNAVYAAILSANCSLELNMAGFQAIKDRDLSYPGMEAKRAGTVLAGWIVANSADYFVTSSMGESLVLASRFFDAHGANCLWNSGTAQEYRHWLVRHFRGLANKTASFAVLLAYPNECDLAIVDRWVLGWLNFRPVKKDGTLRKKNDPTHNEYLMLEQRVRDCYDASRANGNTPDDVSLGIYHWGIWDYVRGHADAHFGLCVR